VAELLGTPDRCIIPMRRSLLTPQMLAFGEHLLTKSLQCHCRALQGRQPSSRSYLGAYSSADITTELLQPGSSPEPLRRPSPADDQLRPTAVRISKRPVHSYLALTTPQSSSRSAFWTSACCEGVSLKQHELCPPASLPRS